MCSLAVMVMMVFGAAFSMLDSFQVSATAHVRERDFVEMKAYHRVSREEPVVVKVVSATTKMCKTCGEIKHFTEFWKHPRTKSFTNLCLACEREAKRKGGLVKRDRNNI
jgi:ABC-type sugar transport system permease subunit